MNHLKSCRKSSGAFVIGSVLIIAAFAGAIFSSAAAADNRVHIDVIHSDDPFEPVDTLYVGGNYEFRLGIENSVYVWGLVLTFRVTHEGGIGMTYVPQPASLVHGEEFTVTPGSRLYPPGEIFDLGGLYGDIVDDYYAENSEVIVIGGGSYRTEGLPPGPLEDMIHLHFHVSEPYDPGVVGTICIDTTEYGCACADNIFNQTYVPDFNLPRCWPVKVLCGDANGNGDVDMFDVVLMINHVFREGPAPDPWQLGDANNDGALNMGDIMYLLYAAMRSGPSPECPDNPPTPPLMAPYPPPPVDSYDDHLMEMLCDSLFFRQ